MHPSLLGEEWCAKNTVVVNQKMCGGEDVEQPAKRLKASYGGDVPPSAGATSSGCSPLTSAGGLAPLRPWKLHLGGRAFSDGCPTVLDTDENELVARLVDHRPAAEVSSE